MTTQSARKSRREPQTKFAWSLLLVLSISWSITADSYSASSSSSSARNSIPRSTQNSHYDHLRRAATAQDDDNNNHNNNKDGDVFSSSLLYERPPWNPSPHIDRDGFCKDAYTRIPGEWESDFQLGGKHENAQHLEMVQVQIRQVPGDGNCLFHSISTCMAHVVNQTQLEYPADLKWLYRHSAALRKQAVDCLRQRRKILFLQGHEYLRARDLVEAAAAQYGISPQEYCDLMQQDSYWGGGPEIVALCNVLKRPIHVYELATLPTKWRGGGGGGGGAFSVRHQPQQFVLRRMACFGSPKYDKKEPFHILSADSRFPDIEPGKQLPSGNHFLAVFPIAEQQAALDQWLLEQEQERRLQRKRHKRRKKEVRGGSTTTTSSNNNNNIHETSGMDENDPDRLAMQMRMADLRKRHEQLTQLRRNNNNYKGWNSGMVGDHDENCGSVRSYLRGLWNRLIVGIDEDDDDDDNEDDDLLLD